ncbi:MAG: hypothetical protein KDI79_03835 [Anaerolineae bacterium]|nr:hypothetical protein [Anaerolineae bacterium]
MTDYTAFLARLIDHKTSPIPAQQQALITHIGRVPFSTAPVAADPGLWGGFWHFDVIGPGYTLPAVELSLLRAIRLDQLWPADTTIEQFVGDLRRAIGHPQAGVWLLRVIDHPCAVLAAPADHSGLVTVVWYCATTDALHAGYRTTPGRLVLPPGATPSHVAAFDIAGPAPVELDQTWLADSVEEGTFDSRPASLSAELDRAILRIRNNF